MIRDLGCTNDAFYSGKEGLNDETAFCEGGIDDIFFLATHFPLSFSHFGPS